MGLVPALPWCACFAASRASRSGPPRCASSCWAVCTMRRADGSPVGGPSWRRTKVQTLFSLLALNCDRPVSREYLLQALWPGVDHQDALHDLDSTIYHLRRSLEPDLRRGLESNCIQHEQDWYLLNGDGAHWLDTEAFEAGISLGPPPARSHPGNGPLPRSAGSLPGGPARGPPT